MYLVIFVSVLSFLDCLHSVLILKPTEAVFNRFYNYFYFYFILKVVTIEEEGGKLIVWTVLDAQHDSESHLGLKTFLCNTL